MNKIYKPNEFAKMIGVSPRTLCRWDKDGKLTAYRTPTQRKSYTHKQYVDYQKQLGIDVDNITQNKEGDKT